MSTQTQTRSRSIWDPQIVRTAIWDSFRKLHPRTMARNPVMFVVEVGCVLTTWRLVQDAVTGSGSIGFELQITALALADGAVRQLRRGDGRGARQGAG